MKTIDDVKRIEDFAGQYCKNDAFKNNMQTLQQNYCALPETTASIEMIKRAGIYLSLLRLMKIRGNLQVIIPHIADLLNLKIQTVEADFLAIGISIQDQPGFAIESLIDTLEERLGFQNFTEAFLVGAGKLGTSLMRNKNLGNTDLKIVAAFDIDPGIIGTMVGSVKVMSPDKICSLASRMHICMGIIATPAGHAQKIADMFIEAGTWSIWNFSPDEIAVPSHIILQNTRIGENLKEGYQCLVEELRKRSKETANSNRLRDGFNY